MYLKHTEYPSPIVPIPSSKAGESVYFGQYVPYLVEVASKVGEELRKFDAIVEVDKDEAEALIAAHEASLPTE